uniref:Uncharacterized protein n=1 Tax=Daphnia magna TaxID=35525 RepID=A0A0P6BPI0_9CRUS
MVTNSNTALAKPSPFLCNIHTNHISLIPCLLFSTTCIHNHLLFFTFHAWQNTEWINQTTGKLRLKTSLISRCFIQLFPRCDSLQLSVVLS